MGKTRFSHHTVHLTLTKPHPKKLQVDYTATHKHLSAMHLFAFTKNQIKCASSYAYGSLESNQQTPHLLLARKTHFRWTFHRWRLALWLIACSHCGDDTGHQQFPPLMLSLFPAQSFILRGTSPKQRLFGIRAIILVGASFNIFRNEPDPTRITTMHSTSCLIVNQDQPCAPFP